MASLYKNNNVWYISVSIGRNRITRSLKTNDFNVAKKLKVKAEYQIIAELMGFTKKEKPLSLSFQKCI